LETSELVEVLVHRVRQVDQQIAAPIYGQRHPLPMGQPGRGDGAVDFGSACQRDDRVRLAGRRVDVECVPPDASPIRSPPISNPPDNVGAKVTRLPRAIRRGRAVPARPITWFRWDAFAHP